MNYEKIEIIATNLWSWIVKQKLISIRNVITIVDKTDSIISRIEKCWYN